MIVKIVRRGVIPLAVLLAAVGSIVYAARYHVVPVLEIQDVEEEITIVVPSAFGLPPQEMSPESQGAEDPMAGGAPGVDGLPGPPGFPGDPAFPFDPAMTQPTIKQKILRTVRTERQELEPRIVLDATIGGLVVLETGELKRTYSGEMEGPALCPT